MDVTTLTGEEMEDSHYNNNYFWTPIPTMAGQFENVMFINKIKEQLMTEKSCAQAVSAASPSAQTAGPQPPSSQPAAPAQPQPHHQAAPAPLQSYPAALGHADPPGGNANDGNPPPASENVTVLPLPSSALMTGLVITSPSSSLSSSSGGLSPLAHAPPTFSLAGAPAMIVSGLAPALSGAEKKGPAEEAQGQQAQAQAKAVGGKKRKGRPSEAPLSDAEDPYAVPNDDEGGKDGKAYRCRVCPLSFLSKSEMQVHSKSHSECKPHHCPHCSKTFANTSYLAQHVRIHSGAKPYNCSYCQKTFRQLSHLQQHTRIHTGDRPYKCSQPGCEKSFTQLSNLQSHRRQHNKDKPFKCPHCHRAYTDSPSLQVHLATHTVKHIKAYACNSCRKSYTSETYLMKHMKKHKAPAPPSELYGAPSGGQGANADVAQCSFDLLPFKPDPHKDPCLTVSTSALQVDQMGGS